MKFLRRTSNRYPKLGKGRKKKQIWRRPTGRDNKMREKRKGYPAVVSIGYKKGEKDQNKFQGKAIIKVENLADLGKIGKAQIGLLGKIGKKKKIEIAKEAKEKKIVFMNFNPETFLEKNKPEEKTKEKTK